MNLYQILEIEPTASHDDIKSAYRRLVFLYHPDKNPNPKAKEKFIQIEEAYTVLSDDRKRRRYDRRLFRKSNFEANSDASSNYTPPPRKSNYTEWLKYQRSKKKVSRTVYKKRVLSKREQTVVAFINLIALFTTASICIFSVGIEDWIFGEIRGKFLIVWMMSYLCFKWIRKLLLHLVNRSGQKHV